MNSVFVNLGIYSCAVNAFLEIPTHLFLPSLSSLRIRTRNLQTAFQCLFSLHVLERRQFIIEGKSRACLVIHQRRL